MERWREPWIEQDPRTNNWNLRWRERGPDGKLHRRSILCLNRQDAILRRDQKRHELRDRAALGVNPYAELQPLLDTYIIYCRQVSQLREGSIETKYTALNRYVQVTKVLGDITRDALIKYRDDLFTALSPVTVGIRMREIKAFVRWLWHEGKLKTNPFEKIEIPKSEPQPRFLTDDELVKIETVASGEFRALYRMAYMTGMRRNELLTASWDDMTIIKKPIVIDGVEILKDQFFITVQATTAKNRRSRTIPLRQEIITLLGTRGNGRLFPGLDDSSLEWAWRSAKARAGITRRVRFHDLRHTFCRLYLQGGGTIADLMSITGHQSLTMMQVYAHFETRWKTERMEAMHLPAALSTGQTTGRIQDKHPNNLEISGNIKQHKETDEVAEIEISPTVNRTESDRHASTIKRRKAG